MQLYALGIPRPGTGHLRLPPFPRKSLYTIAAVIALIGVSEAVKDALSPVRRPGVVPRSPSVPTSPPPAGCGAGGSPRPL